MSVTIGRADDMSSRRPGIFVSKDVELHLVSNPKRLVMNMPMPNATRKIRSFTKSPRRHPEAAQLPGPLQALPRSPPLS